MAYSYQIAEREKEARKLRELFKGRFSDDESLELLNEQGGLSDAVDFILNSNPDEVRRLIHDRNKALVEALRRDSSYIRAALAEGVETSVRQFACQQCDSYWWRRVPIRKEVSRCHLCRTRYDPVPRDQEWGLAEFVCVCGNVFWGSGWMNHTQSPCYNCQNLTCPTRIAPPTKPRTQKSSSQHSCTGLNCYNRSVPLTSQNMTSYGHDVGGGGGGDIAEAGKSGWSERGEKAGEKKGEKKRDSAGEKKRESAGEKEGEKAGSNAGAGRRGGRRGRGRYGEGYYYPPQDDGFRLCASHGQMCAHERSTRQRRVLYPSSPHVSTGSTVNTFMSQGELDEEPGRDLQSLPDLPEADED